MVHAVLARGAPGSARIDLTHATAAHDVRQGALTLWRAAPWLVPGVILAVVDPGVGGERRAVAVEAAGGSAFLVGPDNGLLLPCARRLPPVTRAVEIEPAGPPPAGATFAGRDLFAPAAARLAAGAPLEDLGPLIDPATLAGEPVPVPGTDHAGGVAAEVLWVDRFGNAQLNAAPGEIGGGPMRLEWAGGSRVVRVVASYEAIGPDLIALVVDSYGLLSICAHQQPAASILDLHPGQPVRLRPTNGGPR